jgi:hypothetical protein
MKMAGNKLNQTKNITLCFIMSVFLWITTLLVFWTEASKSKMYVTQNVQLVKLVTYHTALVAYKLMNKIYNDQCHANFQSVLDLMPVPTAIISVTLFIHSELTET